MSQVKMSKSLRGLVDKISSLSGVGWQTFDDELAKLCETVKEKDLEEICLKLDVYNAAFSSCHSSRGWNRSAWMADRFLSAMLPAHVDLGDKVLKKSEVDSVKCLVITNGIYTDISLIDEVAENGSGDSQALAATFCSIDTLRKLKGHKSKKVRKVYYNRLGPVECLDEMLEDKIADIRYEGMARAPYYYEKLKGFTKEIARGPFSLLIEKIPLEYLPMLVANRNVKNSWISRKFERRISAGR